MSVIAAAVQPRIELVYPSVDTFDKGAIGRNVAACAAHVRAVRAATGAGLVVFPEFFLTGYTFGVDTEGWLRASIRIPGPELDGLREAAVTEAVYIAGAAYELIDDFPGRFFNTAFLIGPDGNILLRYRKLYAMTDKTRPSDILDDWVERFGYESLFPVADTGIGRIGAIIARDSHWPELSRCLALRGAEILLNPNAVGTEADDGTRWVRRSRAFENHCYLVAPNMGPFVAGDLEHCDGGRAPTEIVDYRGRVIAGDAQEKEFYVSAELDIEALRRYRTGGSEKGNMLAQLQPQVHAPAYASAELFPTNAWRDKPIAASAENKAVERDAIRRMIDNGVLAAPKDDSGR